MQQAWWFLGFPNSCLNLTEFVQFNKNSCERINSSTEYAHGNTEASVSGYRLDSGTRSMNFEIFALILQDRTHPAKKMKNCTLGVLVVQIAEWFLLFAPVAPDDVNRRFVLVLASSL